MVTGDVPLGLQDLAAEVGAFWYSHNSGQIVEAIDKRAFHVVTGNELTKSEGGTIEVIFGEFLCLENSTFIEGPEFQLFVNGNGCTAAQTIPAKYLNTWVKIDGTGIEAVALPLSTSFSLLIMMNLLSLCFYLLVSIETFESSSGLYEITYTSNTNWITSSIASASAVALIYVSSYDVVRDTQCTDGEAAISSVALTAFLVFVGYGIVSTSDLYSHVQFKIKNVLVLMSSISLSLSVVAVDYFTSEEPYSLVALIVNTASVFVILISVVRPSGENNFMHASERCLVELSIISSLRAIMSAELGVFFALGTGITASILLFKYVIIIRPNTSLPTKER